MSDRVAVLQSIAAFAAKVRGHALAKWRTEDGFAVASCLQCGRELAVYGAAMQPEMDGEALACECQGVVRVTAA